MSDKLEKNKPHITSPKESTSDLKKKVRVNTLSAKKSRGEKLVCITSYDATFTAIIEDSEAVDIILVGDSLGTVIQGEELTLYTTLEEMIYHSRCVSRGIRKSLLVTDLPFLSYQTSVEQAVISAGRLVKEGRAEAVKLEGGQEFAKHIAAITQAGIPVVAHLGLLPQSYQVLSGYRTQGRESGCYFNEERLINDAKEVESAGAVAVVLEGVVSEAARKITEMLKIPTIGIGASNVCDGQILVLYDLLGLRATSAGNLPKFVKSYESLGERVKEALKSYETEVKSGAFPTDKHSYL
jgi:3-methyl-2-oxobutanoate hydroxymethyltransferase